MTDELPLEDEIPLEHDLLLGFSMQYEKGILFEEFSGKSYREVCDRMTRRVEELAEDILRDEGVVADDEYGTELTRFIRTALFEYASDLTT